MNYIEGMGADAWLMSHVLHWWTEICGLCHMNYIGGLGRVAHVTSITLAGKNLWLMANWEVCLMYYIGRLGCMAQVTCIHGWDRTRS